MSDGEDWIIDCDAHVIEPPGVWLDRLPKKFQDIGPRFLQDDDGWAWFYEDIRVPILGPLVSGPEHVSQKKPSGIGFDDFHPACYDPSARVEAMNADRVLAQMVFPNFPRFCGQTFHEAKDHELGMLCVQAYNDWLIDEWGGTAPGRFIPTVLIPLWDPRLGAAELERCAAKVPGGFGVCLSEDPYQLGLPSLYDADGYWDPILATCQEAGIVACTHLGSSSFRFPTPPDAPPITAAIQGMVASPLRAWMDWIVSGKLQQFPGLRVSLTEGQAGWAPFAMLELERYMTDDKDYIMHWLSRPEDLRQLVRDHFCYVIADDPIGLAHVDLLGIENFTVETDFPHEQTKWPRSADLFREQLGGFSAEDQLRLLSGNAKRIFNFTPAEAPSDAVVAKARVTAEAYRDTERERTLPEAYEGLIPA